MDVLQYFLVLYEHREFIDKDAFKAHVIQHKQTLDKVIQLPVRRREVLEMLVCHKTDPYDLLKFMLEEFPARLNPNYCPDEINRPLIWYALRWKNYRCAIEIAKHLRFSGVKVLFDLYTRDVPDEVIEIILAHANPLEGQNHVVAYNHKPIVKSYARNPQLVCTQLRKKYGIKCDMLSARVFCLIRLVQTFFLCVK